MTLLTNFLRLFFSALSLPLFSSSISSCACFSASFKKKKKNPNKPRKEIYFRFRFPGIESRPCVPARPVPLFWDVVVNHRERNCRNHTDRSCTGRGHPGLLEHGNVSQIKVLPGDPLFIPSVLPKNPDMTKLRKEPLCM